MFVVALLALRYLLRKPNPPKLNNNILCFVFVFLFCTEECQNAKSYARFDKKSCPKKHKKERQQLFIQPIVL